MCRKDRINKYIKSVRIWKTVTWRIISWVASFLIAFMITGNIAIAITFGMADTLLKTIMYWAHEYKWDKVTNKKIKRIKVKYQ